MTTISIEKAYCTTSLGQVHIWSAGEGQVLLLLHQASQSSREFLAAAPHLAEHVRIVAIDYPGHGRSDDPEQEPDVPDYGAAAMAVLDELGIATAHICGHHSGGILAAHLATTYPDRFDRLVISGIGERSEEAIKAVLERPMSRDLPIDANGEFLDKTWHVYRELSSPGTAPSTTFEFFRVSLEARTRPYDAHFAFMRWDRDPAIAAIHKPTLLLCGEHDIFAENPESLLEMIPGSRLAMVPGGGAFLFYEKPAECAAAIIDFLADE